MSERSKVSAPGNIILRIEVDAARRRHLVAMASEAGKSIDKTASELLCEVIDDDLAAHAEAT